MAGAAFELGFELLPVNFQKHIIAGASTASGYAGEGLRYAFGMLLLIQQ